MISDGHLQEKRVLFYDEQDPERRQRVKDLLNQLGDVQYNEVGSRLRIPVPVGRLLEKFGMPIGNKTLQQTHLPESIRNGSKEVKVAYLQELIPEDGHFHKKTGAYSWNRAIAIELKKESLQLIRNFGKRKIHDFGIGTKKQATEIRISQLSDLLNLHDLGVNTTAKQLLNTVRQYPNQLMKDEVELARSLGIEVEMHPDRIVVWEKSGKVTVQWGARTCNTNSSIRWSVMAPPNDLRKRNAVADWLVTNFVKPTK